MKPLTDALKSLAKENARVSPPADLERRVLDAFDAAATPRQQWLRPTIAAAALSAGAVLLLRVSAVPQREQPFVQIPYVAPPAPYERVTVFRQDVPVTALIAAGFRVHAADAGASVTADLLVGQDGRPLAIRMVSKP